MAPNGDTPGSSSDVKITVNRLEDEAYFSVTRTQYISTFIVTLSALSCGAFVSWTSSALPLLTADGATLQISENEGSWIASLLGVGAFLGSASMAFATSDGFVRKATLLFLVVPMFVSSMLMMFSTSVYCFYVARLVGGFGVGALCLAAPAFADDVLRPPHEPRSAAGRILQLQATAGLLVGYAAGLTHHIKLISLICGCTPLLFLIACAFLPDSPAYLVSQGKAAEARNSVAFYRETSRHIDSDIARVRERVQEIIHTEGPYADLVATKSNFKASIVAVYLMVFAQLGGAGPVLLYLNDIMEDFDAWPGDDSSVMIAAGVTLTLCALSAWKLRSLQRRKALIYSNCIMCVAACCLSVFYHTAVAVDLSSFTWVPLVGVILYLGAFVAGVAPISFTILDELFPLYLKRKSKILSVALTWLVSSVVAKYYHAMSESTGTGWALWNFGCSCGIAAFIAYFLVPETKGKTPEEVHNELNGDYPLRFKYVIELDSPTSTLNNSTTNSTSE